MNDPKGIWQSLDTKGAKMSAAEIRAKAGKLEAEIRRLRSENATQAARIQQLERTLRILQTRLGIVEKQ